MTDNDGSSSRLGEDLVREVRLEIDRSAADLHRLTERVKDQNVAVERLEVLVTEVLDLLPEPVVVVDANGLVAAVSRGAGEQGLGVSRDTVGQPASSVLPGRLGSVVAAVSRDQPDAVITQAGRPEDPAGWVEVDGARVVALPGGWALAVMSV